MDAWCCKTRSFANTLTNLAHGPRSCTCALSLPGHLKHLEMWFLFFNLKAHLLIPRVGFAHCNLCSFGKTPWCVRHLCLTFDPSVKMLSVVVSTLTHWKGHAHAQGKKAHTLLTRDTWTGMQTDAWPALFFCLHYPSPCQAPSRHFKEIRKLSKRQRCPSSRLRQIQSWGRKGLRC